MTRHDFCGAGDGSFRAFPGAVTFFPGGNGARERARREDGAGRFRARGPYSCAFPRILADLARRVQKREALSFFNAYTFRI